METLRLWGTDRVDSWTTDFVTTLVESHEGPEPTTVIVNLGERPDGFEVQGTFPLASIIVKGGDGRDTFAARSVDGPKLIAYGNKLADHFIFDSGEMVAFGGNGRDRFSIASHTLFNPKDAPAKGVVRDFDPDLDTIRFFWTDEGPSEVSEEDVIAAFKHRKDSVIFRHDFDNDGEFSRIVFRNTDLNDIVLGENLELFLD